MGPNISYVDAAQADPLPQNLRLGIGYDVLESKFNSLVLTVDFTKLLVNRTLSDTVNGVYVPGEVDPFYEALFTSWGDGLQSIQTSIGAEYWYGNPRLIALRGGYFYEDPSYGNRKFFTLGAGIRYDLYGFDFAYISTIEETHPLANTLRFGLQVSF